MQVNGKIEGIKRNLLESLESLYEIRVPKELIFTPEMVAALAEATYQTNREIAVYIDRKGYVLDIRVGDSKTVTLGEVEGRRKETGLSGVRCV